jgi:2-polyprenyl-3-methyl-5-hydroxy-6-metoxy-1,4-benzoquinol methylase
MVTREYYMKCPICCSKNKANNYQIEIINDDTIRVGKRFYLKWCPYCRMGYTSPFPTDSDMSRLYDQNYGSFIAKKRSIVLQYLKYIIGKMRYYNYFKNKNALIEKTFRSFSILIELITGKSTPYTLGIPLQLDKGDEILEIGYGTGWWLLWMKKMGYENLVGCDISSYNEERLKMSGIKTYCGSLKDIDRSIGKFKLVRLQHVLEHVPDPVHFLEEIKAIMHDDGIIVLVVPNINSLSYKLFGISFASLVVPHHIFHHSSQSLAKIFNKSGLSIKAIKTVGQSSVFCTSFEAFLSSRNMKLIAKLVNNKITRYLLSPIISMTGFVGVGDEISIVANINKDAQQGCGTRQ